MRGPSDILRHESALRAEAFEQALRPHLPMLLAYTRAICGDHHTAEDVVQDVALIAYRNLHHLFPETDFASWLKAIARRQALAAGRERQRVLDVTHRFLEEAYADPAPEDTERERTALRICLGKLPAPIHEIVRSHYFEGASIAQLASARGMNVNTVKTHLFRARQALEECMRRQWAREPA